MDTNPEAEKEKPIQTPDKTEIQPPLKKAPLTPGVKRSLVVLSVAIFCMIVGMLIYWVIHNQQNKNNDQATNTADQIRQSFQSTTTNPSFIPPFPSFGTSSAGSITNTPSQSSSATSSNPSNSTAQTPQRGTNNQTPSVTTPSPSTAPTQTTYKNSALGFELSMPSSWRTDASQGPNKVMFFDATGQMAGYVESYVIPSGESLDSVTKILQSSPSVSAVSRTTVSGQSALTYTSDSGIGIAVLSSGRIYYLHGSLASPARSATFKFINPS